MRQNKDNCFFRQTHLYYMKQKLKNLLKKKPARLTIDEIIIDPAFTVLTDEQKAGKKAGVADDPLNRNGFENPHFGLVNNVGFNPTNNNLRGVSNNFVSSGRFEIVDGIPIAYRGPDVIIRDTRINKPTNQNFPIYPYWPTRRPVVVTPHATPSVDTGYIPQYGYKQPTPEEISEWNARYPLQPKNKYGFYIPEKEWSIIPDKVETGAIQNTTIGATKTDLFEDEEARKRSEIYKNRTLNTDYSGLSSSECADYYRWAHKQLEGKSKWFGAVAIVTEAYNNPLFNDAAKKLLREVDINFIAGNIQTANAMIHRETTPRKGKKYGRCFSSI